MALLLSTIGHWSVLHAYWVNLTPNKDGGDKAVEWKDNLLEFLSHRYFMKHAMSSPDLPPAPRWGRAGGGGGVPQTQEASSWVGTGED